MRVITLVLAVMFFLLTAACLRPVRVEAKYVRLSSTVVGETVRLTAQIDGDPCGDGQAKEMENAGISLFKVLDSGVKTSNDLIDVSQARLVRLTINGVVQQPTQARFDIAPIYALNPHVTVQPGQVAQIEVDNLVIRKAGLLSANFYLRSVGDKRLCYHAGGQEIRLGGAPNTMGGTLATSKPAQQLPTPSPETPSLMPIAISPTPSPVISNTDATATPPTPEISDMSKANNILPKLVLSGFAILVIVGGIRLLLP